MLNISVVTKVKILAKHSDFEAFWGGPVVDGAAPEEARKARS